MPFGFEDGFFKVVIGEFDLHGTILDEFGRTIARDGLGTPSRVPAGNDGA
jgi:hypothetical protein